MKKYTVLILTLLSLLLLLPRPDPAQAQATSTPTPIPTSTATATATSTATATATANIWYIATTSVGQGWQVEYSANLGDIVEFMIRSILVGLGVAVVVLFMRRRP